MTPAYRRLAWLMLLVCLIALGVLAGAVAGAAR